MKKTKETVNLSIGDIVISVEYRPGRGKGIFEGSPYTPFITKKNPDVFLRLEDGPPPVFEEDSVIFRSEDIWRLSESNGRYLLEDPRRLIVFDSDFKSGTIHLKKKQLNPMARFIMTYPLGEVFLINLLGRGYGVVFHACGLIDDKGCGHLFLGNSTNGKSTMAGLWSEDNATVLNDDRIIVRERDGQFWMYGTPWHGDFKEVSADALPIHKIFFLKHGKENSAISKEGLEAVSMLLTRSFPPLWDQKGMGYTLNLLDGMATKLRCYELNFLPDKRIIDFVKNI